MTPQIPLIARRWSGRIATKAAEAAPEHEDRRESQEAADRRKARPQTSARLRRRTSKCPAGPNMQADRRRRSSRTPSAPITRRFERSSHTPELSRPSVNSEATPSPAVMTVKAISGACEKNRLGADHPHNGEAEIEGEADGREHCKPERHQRSPRGAVPLEPITPRNRACNSSPLGQFVT